MTRIAQPAHTGKGHGILCVMCECPMNAKHRAESFLGPKELAGVRYHELMQSEEKAKALLLAPEPRLRLAAIMVCRHTWKCGRDPLVIRACYDLAASNYDDSIRICAIDALGILFESSQSPDIMTVLADLVMNECNSLDVQRAAYWTLREVYFGPGDTDFDMFVRGVIYQIKRIIDSYPEAPPESEAKTVITPSPGFPPGFWDSADTIDYDFARRFASHNE